MFQETCGTFPQKTNNYKASWWNGIHGRLKICCLKACGFESHRSYHIKMIVTSINYNPYLYQPAVLTISQVAMQFNVGIELIRKWTENGLIPHIELTNGEYRYKIKEVRDAFLKNNFKDK